MGRRISFAFVAVSLVLALGNVPGVAQGQGQSQTRHGRLFAPVDLGLLEGPDRDLWQMPGPIMDALGIAEGSVVGDLGVGGGWFTIRLARRVGPNGVVYAEDIQRAMLEATSRRVAREALHNVRTVLGTPRDPRFPPGQLDAVLIVNTYRELQIEDPVTLLRHVATSLTPQGRIGIIDFTRDGLGPGPDLEERVEPAVVERDADAAGLRVLRRETFLPYQFFLILVRK